MGAPWPLSPAKLGRGVFCGLLMLPLASLAQVPGGAAQELLRQQERERILREQLESVPAVRLPTPQTLAPDLLPSEESPCFVIHDIRLTGEDARTFAWALQAADPVADPATGRCLGAAGINIVMTRVQNAIIARGYVTTRVLAAPQDLKSGVLSLAVLAGRVRSVRFTETSARRAQAWNAVPITRGEILNLRDIEQALENFRRVPTVDTDIQIVPAQGDDARAGESDVLISWVQGRPVRLSLSLDDSGSLATGRLQAGATLSIDDPLALNDLLYASFNHDVFNGSRKGTRGYTVHYSVPFGYWQLGATASGYRYHQTVAGYSQNYVYSGTSANGDVRLSRLLYRDASRKSSAYLRGWVRQSNNYIDDTEIEVQRRRTAGWEFGLTHREYLRAATLDVSLAYRQGTGAMGSRAAPEEDFGEGTSRMRLVTADAQLMVPFQLAGQSLRYATSWRAQWNRTPLVPQDRFAIGGRYSVRGFDGELSLIGEHGWVWRNELALALGAGHELYAAADMGRVGGPSTDWLLGHSLAGAALGLRGGWRGVNWDVFVGTPLRKPSGFQTDSVTAGFSLLWSY